jgi:hypothetical protein
MPTLASTSITLDPTSGKLHTIITVTDSDVSPSTSARIWFDNNIKGKEVALLEKLFTKSF